MKVLEALRIFLSGEEAVFADGKQVCPPRRTPANSDLIDRCNAATMEYQINMQPGEPVPGKERRWYAAGFFTAQGKPLEYWNIRVPEEANSNPHWEDYELPGPLELLAKEVGSTGFDYGALRSRWVGFDFDNLEAHVGDRAISPEELEEVKAAVMKLPYVELRNSTSGSGLHAYVFMDDAGIPCENHTIHATLARAVLKKMSDDTDYAFSDKVDCAGGNMWIWSRRATAENGGFRRTKTATQAISEADLPVTWRDDFTKKKPEPNRASAPSVKRSSAEDDFIRNSKFEFLVEHGWTRVGDSAFLRPGVTDKFQSASVVTADDGTRLLHVFTSSAPPFEKDKSYNAFTAYALLKHNSNKAAAVDELRNLGFGGFKFPLISAKEFLSANYKRDYLVKGAMVEGQPMIAAGQAKSLKTSMILDLIVSLITKKKFLEKFPVLKQSNVILMSGESGLDSLQDTTLRILRSKGVEDRDLWDHLFCSETLPRFGNVDHLNALDRMLQETGSKVLIIDPIYLCMAGTDAGNLFARGSFSAGITEIGRKHDATLVLLHHTRKQPKAKKLEAAAPAELEDMAWAGFTESARQWISCQSPFSVCPWRLASPVVDYRRLRWTRISLGC